MASESTVYFVVCQECGEKVPLPPQAIGENRSNLWDVVACLDCNCEINYDFDQVRSMPLVQWHELIHSKV